MGEDLVHGPTTTAASAIGAAVCACLLMLPACFEPEVTSPPPLLPIAADPAPEAAVTQAVAVEPELVAYGTPEVEEAQVIRTGNKVNLRLRWSAVEGASAFRVEVAKVLTFSRPVKAADVRRPQFVAARLQPAVYFWRVRATGEAGDGGWSAVQVLDATKTGKRGARAPRLAVSEAEAEAASLAKAATAAVPPTPGLPLRLVWRTPPHQSIATKSPVLVEGVATRGTEVRLNSEPPVAVSATFSISYALKHGRNDLNLVATLGPQTKNLTRVVFYADPARLAPIKERFEQLRAQLEEIGAIRDELSTTVKSLETQLKAKNDQAGMAAVKEEMTRINEIRREIDAEINRAIGDLDRLLGT